MRKILIVDDEPAACANLLNKIKRINSELEIKTSTKPLEALTLITTFQPDILFLDISMPDLTGFEFLDSIEENDKKFALIFSTAYSEHAIRAFEANAIDYLVKPVNNERLHKALEKAENMIQGNWAKKIEKIEKPTLTRIACTKGSSKHLIDVDDVSYFTSSDHETITVVNNKEYFFSRSLNFLEKQLDAGQFFRCHRSYIANLNKVKLIDKPKNEVFFQDGSGPIAISKRKKTEFLKCLNL